MKALQELLLARQAHFERHPFFACLAIELPLAQILAFAPKLTFWVMAFQDVLRLNASLMRDPALKQLALRHRQEGSGHDVWFLQDIRRLGADAVDVRALFSPEHAAIRDASYALVAEVLSATEEPLRVALVLALEAAGQTFSERVARFVDGTGDGTQLAYFSRHPRQLVADHDLFVDDLGSESEELEMPAALRPAAAAAVGRVFAAFESMFDALMSDLAPVAHLLPRGAGAVATAAAGSRHRGLDA